MGLCIRQVLDLIEMYWREETGGNNPAMIDYFEFKDWFESKLEKI